MPAAGGHWVDWRNLRRREEMEGNNERERVIYV